MSSADAILEHLMQRAPTSLPLDTLEAWWSIHEATVGAFERPVDVAMAAGFAADRLGWAFGSGYQCAGEAMFGARARGRRTALCATEQDGVHPRAIRTRLERHGGGWLLNGEKSFVTFGAEAVLLAVVASIGQSADGKNMLKVALVEPGAGVHISVHDVGAFVPEIPHARVRFDGVALTDADLLPGDGYDVYLKPFRTVEDIHVHAALVGYLVAVARRHALSRHLVERLLASATSLRSLASADPSRPALHVALGGVLANTGVLLADMETEWPRVGAPTRERWQRDRALLDVAGRARGLRLEAAWKRLTEPGA